MTPSASAASFLDAVPVAHFVVHLLLLCEEQHQSSSPVWCRQLRTWLLVCIGFLRSMWQNGMMVRVMCYIVQHQKTPQTAIIHLVSR